MGDTQPDSDALWQMTVEHSPVGMAVVMPDGRLLSANRSLCAMLGYTEQQLREIPFQQFSHPDDLQTDLDLYRQTLAGKISTYRILKRYLHADGSVIWGDLSVGLVRDADGEPLRFISQVLDVTDQVADRALLARATARSEQQRRLTEAIVDTADTGLALLDSSGRYVRMSRRHADFLALAFPEGHRGWAGQVGAVFAADGRTRLGRDDMPSTRALAEGRFDDYRVWVGEDPARRRALNVSARSVLDDDGSVSGVVLNYNDVTDLVRSVDARDQFVAAVSHELRTPLTSVLNHLELLLTTPEDHAADTIRSLEVARRNGLRLQRLVSDLLASAQERAGGLLLDRAVVDVVTLAREAVEVAEPAARHRRVHLALHGPAHLRAEVDPFRVRQVIDNLVSNAVTYTGPGGRVDVTVAPHDRELVIEVLDTGIGISAEHLDRVFEPFFRSAAAKAQSAPGLGLGLGVVKTVVDAHRGRTTITSEPGQGTSVMVRLPLGETGA